MCLSYVTLKFWSTYLFLWGHELSSSFRLFRLQSFFTNDDEFFMKTNANVAMGFTFYNNLFNGAALLRPTLY